MPVTLEAPAQPLLLDDAQMRRFFTQGFLTFKASVPSAVNEAICAKLADPVHTPGNGGNNVLPAIPELQHVFADPVLVGALASVLGPTNIMHPHRATHYTPARTERRGWHKDSYWGYHRKVRNHRPWWAMIMYYPQDVTPEMGPTGVLPGRQNHQTRGENDEAGQTTVVGEAGTFFMIQYDLWHTDKENRSDRDRYMLKFEFIRMDRPTAPTWTCGDRHWQDPPREDWPVYPHRTMWRQMWDWTAGNAFGTSRESIDEPVGKWLERLNDADGVRRAEAADVLGLIGDSDAKVTATLAARLGDICDPVGINRAYALAAMGEAAIDPLAQAVAGQDDHARRNAAYALASVGAPAVDRLLDLSRDDQAETRAAACFALGEVVADDDRILEALGAETADNNVQVRINAVEALGHRGTEAAGWVGALIDRLADDQDEDVEVRFNAALSLARIGPAAQEATATLVQCLHDANRYVRGYSVEALHRINTPDAQAALIQHLKATRWCIDSTAESPFFP